MRLRIAHVLVQPVLVWDDGDDLTPGPELQPVSVPFGQLGHFIESLPAEVAQLAAQVAEQ